MDCQGYEIAIEQQQRGELNEQDAEQLSLHISSCKSCQSFRNFVLNMEETMHAHTADALSKLDWTAISKEIARWRHHVRTSLWKGAALGLLTIPFTVVLLRDQGIVTTAFTSTAAIVAVLLFGRKKQKQLLLELEQADRSDDELLNVYREHLEREIAIKRQDSWALPLFALLPLFLLDTREAANIVAVGALMALLLALGGWVRFSVLPRLLRNREALG